MKYKYWLPDENGMKKDIEVENNSIIIIGANGAGKSKLGAWIEQQNFNYVHRIAAQKKLTFGEYIPLKSYEEAENIMIYGSNDPNYFNNKNYRWDWGKGYTTKQLDDYEAVLAALIAKKNKQQEDFINKFKNLSKNDRSEVEDPLTVIDKMTNIWKKIFPHRNIKFDDAKIIASFTEEEKNQKYNAREMSEGERVVLYLIAQCLCIPNEKIIIIDEPELHLHRSIMNRLWLELENERKDCLFIYITHDTQFAAGHAHSQKIWVKSYDGETWKLESVNKSEIPEQCLLDILGNRKDVLFVEGTQDSYDTNIYREIYKDKYIVPCGSCTKVIEYTKAMNSNNQLHHLKATGLIDRDYRTENEINSLKESNIYVLEIAEVENLFCVEEVLDAINKHQGFTNYDNVDKVKDYIIERRFSNQIKNQISKAVISEIKYLLSIYDLNGKELEDIKINFNSIGDKISFEDIKGNIEEKFKKALNEKEYFSILRLFNEKGLSKSIGTYFNIKNEDYCDLIIRLLKSNQSNEIIGGIKKYLPKFDD